MPPFPIFRTWRLRIMWCCLRIFRPWLLATALSSAWRTCPGRFPQKRGQITGSWGTGAWPPRRLECPTQQWKKVMKMSFITTRFGGHSGLSHQISDKPIVGGFKTVYVHTLRWWCTMITSFWIWIGWNHQSAMWFIDTAAVWGRVMFFSHTMPSPNHRKHPPETTVESGTKPHSSDHRRGGV